MARRSDSSDQIVAKNLETGEVRVLVRDDRSRGGFPFLSLSPDGRWLAFISIQLYGDRIGVGTTGLHVMPATGGEPRELLRRDPPETLTAGLAWTPDGSALIFGTHQVVPHEPERRQTLWRVSVEGGDPTPVGVTLVGLQDLSLHPDGRRLAFDVGREEAEVWVMENFLPELKGETVSEVRP